jgi:hypothetical protein
VGVGAGIVEGGGGSGEGDGGGGVGEAGGGGGGGVVDEEDAFCVTFTELLVAVLLKPLLRKYRNSYLREISVLGALNDMAPLVPAGTYFHTMTDGSESLEPTWKRPIQSVAEWFFGATHWTVMRSLERTVRGEAIRV